MRTQDEAFSVQTMSQEFDIIIFCEGYDGDEIKDVDGHWAMRGKGDFGWGTGLTPNKHVLRIGKLSTRMDPRFISCTSFYSSALSFFFGKPRI